MASCAQGEEQVPSLGHLLPDFHAPHVVHPRAHTHKEWVWYDSRVHAHECSALAAIAHVMFAREGSLAIVGMIKTEPHTQGKSLCRAGTCTLLAAITPPKLWETEGRESRLKERLLPPNHAALQKKTHREVAPALLAAAQPAADPLRHRLLQGSEWSGQRAGFH